MDREELLNKLHWRVTNELRSHTDAEAYEAVKWFTQLYSDGTYTRGKTAYEEYIKHFYPGAERHVAKLAGTTSASSQYSSAQAFDPFGPEAMHNPFEPMSDFSKNPDPLPAVTNGSPLSPTETAKVEKDLAELEARLKNQTQTPASNSPEVVPKAQAQHTATSKPQVPASNTPQAVQQEQIKHEVAKSKGKAKAPKTVKTAGAEVKMTGSTPPAPEPPKPRNLSKGTKPMARKGGKVPNPPVKLTSWDQFYASAATHSYPNVGDFSPISKYISVNPNTRRDYLNKKFKTRPSTDNLNLTKHSPGATWPTPKINTTPMDVILRESAQQIDRQALRPLHMATMSDPWKMTDHRGLGQVLNDPIDYQRIGPLEEARLSQRLKQVTTRRRINNDREAALRIHEIQDLQDAAKTKHWRTGVPWDQAYTADNLNNAPNPGRMEGLMQYTPGDIHGYVKRTLGDRFDSNVPPLISTHLDLGDYFFRKHGAGKWASAKYQRMYGSLEKDDIFSQAAHMTGMNHSPWMSDRKLRKALAGHRRRTGDWKQARYGNVAISGEKELIRNQLRKRIENRRNYSGIGKDIAWQSVQDEIWNIGTKIGMAGAGIGIAAGIGAAAGTYVNDPVHGAMAGVAIGGAVVGLRAYGKMSRENFAHAAGRAKADELEARLATQRNINPHLYANEQHVKTRGARHVKLTEAAHQKAWESHWFSKLNNSPVVAGKYLAKKTFAGIGSRALMVGELAGGMGGLATSVALLGAGAARSAYHGGLVAEYVARAALTGGTKLTGEFNGINPNMKKAWFPFTGLPGDDARRIGLNPRIASRMIGAAAIGGIASFAKEMFSQGAKAPTAHFDGLYMHHMNDMGANGAYAQNILGDAGMGFGTTGIRAGAMMVDDAALMAARVLLQGRI